MRAISDKIGTTELFECCTQSTTETINCFPKTLNIKYDISNDFGKSSKNTFDKNDFDNKF